MKPALRLASGDRVFDPRGNRVMVEAFVRHARVEHRADGRLPPLGIEILNEFSDAYSGELRTLPTNVLVNNRGEVFA